MSAEAWKAAHDALKHYHAVRRTHGSSHNDQLRAWGDYIAALRVAQSTDRQRRKEPAR